MTKLLNFMRPAGGAPAQMTTPEDLVAMAERIGRISIEQHYSSKAYKAHIRFENRNGSTVWAAGEDMDFFTAIAKSILEAERLR